MGWTRFTELLEQHGKVLGALVALGSAALVAWKWVSKHCAAIAVGHALREHFGTDPAGTIRKILDEIKRTQGKREIHTRIIARHLNLGIYVCAPSGQCTDCNDVCCELFGRDSREMLGFGWLEAVVPEDRQQVYEFWTYCVEHGLPYSAAYTVQHAETNERFRCRTQAFAGVVDGVTVCWVGYVTRVDNE